MVVVDDPREKFSVRWTTLGALLAGVLAFTASSALAHRTLTLAGREIAAVQDKVAGLRRFGAASLDLAWVAAGRLDALLGAQPLALGHRGGRHPGARGRRLRHRSRRRRQPLFATGDILAGNEIIHRELSAPAQGRRKGLTADPPCRGNLRPEQPLLRACDARRRPFSFLPPCLCHIVRRPTRGAQPPWRKTSIRSSCRRPGFFSSGCWCS